LLDGDNDGADNTLGVGGEIGKVSCAGCHIPEAGFSDDRSPSQQLSLAAGWGIRRSPSLLDVGQSTLVMWDGRHDTLHGQIFGVLESPVEGNSSRLYAAQQIFAHHRTEYEAVFGEAMPPLDDTARFPALAGNETGCRELDADNECTTAMRGAPGDGAEYDGMAPEDQDAATRVVINVGKAVAAYERLLTCGPSRFDAWMRGDDGAMSDAEQRGAALFVGAGDCVRCHAGPFFSDEAFHNVGLMPRVASVVFVDMGDDGALTGMATAIDNPLNVRSAWSDGDDGRLPTAVDPALEGAFRTPRLRCVAERPSFMHTAHITTLAATVQFFARGGDGYGYPGVNELAPVVLTPEDEDDLVAFLEALTGSGPDPSLLEPLPQ
jgi:cytochrome c peroxidase